MDENIVKKVCKELGIDSESIHKYPTLQKVFQEYEELKTFEKVLRRMLGVDRVLNSTRFGK